MNRLLKLSKRLMLFSLAMLAYAGRAEAQTYLCIADMATGFRFDKPTKKWVTAQFDVTDDKYILTKKWSEIGKGMRWTWTKVGETFGTTCGEKEEFTERGYFRCESLSIKYMNRENKRFQVTYPYGYPNDADTEEEGANTPHIQIGRCAEVKGISGD
jgi:hypothetical protein